MNLLASIFTVGGYTLASRVLGFIRDILIAHALGTGLAADAFFVSQRFPNLFRSLFAEGAFASAFVPEYTKRLTGRGDKEADRYASDALATMAAFTIALTVICQLAMPWIMMVYSYGFLANPAKFKLAAIALTDHDTVEGCARAQTACQAAGIQFVPGSELTAEQNETRFIFSAISSTRKIRGCSPNSPSARPSARIAFAKWSTCSTNWACRSKPTLCSPSPTAVHPAARTLPVPS